MKYRRFDPLGRDLSRIVLGTDVFARWSDDRDRCFALCDAWVELGGNVIDTARRYGDAERVVGEWLRSRGAEERVTVLTKGAHPDLEWNNRLRPEAITDDLEVSLTNLGLDRIDLYLLHRDDPAVPVGPVLETLNRHRREGRIAAFGASNWTSDRIGAARLFAEATGLEPFACASPSLSLALWRQPPWPGTVSAHDREARDWYESEQLPLFSWSAQAQGYFAGVDTEHNRLVYDLPANAERLRRAEAIAAARGATANQVALAWVLSQPFPVYALIGPHTVDELRSSVDALEIDLSREELAWLDLEDE